MRCIPVDKCIRWVDSKSIQLSCKYAEAFLKVQITCFYISHLPPTQPPCSWLTLLGNLVDDDLMTYEHTPPSQRLLQPACTQLRWQGPQGTAHWMHMTVWTPSPLLPFPSSRHSEEVFSSSHTAPPTHSPGLRNSDMVQRKTSTNPNMTHCFETRLCSSRYDLFFIYSLPHRNI